MISNKSGEDLTTPINSAATGFFVLNSFNALYQSMSSAKTVVDKLAGISKFADVLHTESYLTDD